MMPTGRPLLSYALGNAGAWLLWAAISISADHRYWWPVIPLAAVFLLEALAGFTWSTGEPHWWLYAPIALTLALLAVAVAGAGDVLRPHRPRRMLPLH